MQKITAIQAQKKNPNRVNIYLDGDFAFGLARITGAWLRVGQLLEPDEITRLKDKDARERALQQAMLFLSYRDRSEAEIRQNLRKHKTPDDVIENVLAHLRQNHFADDAKFAQTWVDNRSTFRPRGRRALALELRQKGIDEVIIDKVLESVDDEALAREAGLKKARKLQVQDETEFRKKLSDFLARRGFPYSVIKPAVSEIWEQTRTKADQQSVDNEENS
jgi:regulatory protein